MANPIAVPGTNVPSGAAVSPGGAQGLAGTPAWTTCTSSFTIPAVGSTVSVPVVDTSWITTGEMIYIDQAGGSGQSGILQVTAKAGNTLTLLNPAPAPAIPPADSTQAGLLKQLSGNTTDFVDGTNTCQNLVTAVQPTIWSARLRSFNAIGNPSFEVDQRNVGAALTNPASTTFLQDRWTAGKAGTLTGAVNTALQDASTAPIVIPGTSFGITSKFQRLTVGTAQASLAAGDYWLLQQTVEGPRWRELASDVHSISLLVRSSVAGLKFSVSLQDSPVVHSLVSQCTISAANTWTLLQLPNLVNWSGNFSAAAGQVAYFLRIVLAAGTTFSAAANTAWQAANILGVTGMSNFLATAGATFDIAYAGHEPGAIATTPQDCPWQQNYDDCLRYYQKTYDYATAVGTVTAVGVRSFIAPTAQASASGIASFHKPMAKTPTTTLYNYGTGAANSVRDGAGVDHASAAANNVGVAGFNGVSFATATTAAMSVNAQWTADTGW